MEKEKIYFYFFLALVLFFVFAALFMLLPFAIPILWAIVFGIVLYPIHMYLERFLRSRTLSALFMTILVFFLLIVPFGLVSFLLLQQILELTKGIVSYFQSHSYDEVLESIRRHPLVEKHAQELSPILSFVEGEEFRKLVVESTNKAIRLIGDKLGQAVLVAGRDIFYAFVFLLTFFFILRDGPGILKRIERLMPMDKEDLENILWTVYKTVLAVVYGSLGTAFIQAILGFTGYYIAGIKFALLWGVLTFFSAFIPPFGASAVWFPLAVYSFFNVGVWQAIFLFFWGLVLISTVDNFLRPFIIKRGVSIPYVVLFFATIGGLLKFGLIGLFLGPIVFTTLFALFKIYERKILGREGSEN